MTELVEFNDAEVSELPTAFKRDGGYLYGLEFESGLVKIGRAINPRERMRQHRRTQKEVDGALLQGWLSPPHRNYTKTEGQLLKAVTPLARAVMRTEYLYGVPLAATASAALTIEYDFEWPPEAAPRDLRLLNIANVAEMLDIDRREVRRRIDAGELRAMRLVTGRGPFYVPIEELAGAQR